MKMIKKKLLLLAAAGCFLISGCRSPQASAEVRSTAAKETMRQETETSNDKGGEEMENMESMELTDQEKRLLCEIYPMEERIMEGRLFNYQKDTVTGFRAGMDYLARKYPGYDFEALSITPASKFDPWMIVRIQSGDAGIWELKVTPEKEGFSFADTFYNALMQEKYDSMVEELLKAAGFEVRSYTVFTAPQEKTGPETTVEELRESRLPRMTHLFIQKPENKEAQDETAEAVQSALKNAGVYGNYILYFVPGGLVLDAEELEKQRLQMESRAFSCHDVK